MAYKNLLIKNINTNEIIENCQIDEFLFQTENDQKLYHNINTNQFELLEITTQDIDYITYKIESSKKYLIFLLESEYEYRKQNFKINNEGVVIDFSASNMRCSDLSSFCKKIIKESQLMTSPLPFPRIFYKLNITIESEVEANFYSERLDSFSAKYFDQYINVLYLEIKNLTVENYLQNIDSIQSTILGLPVYTLVI